LRDVLKETFKDVKMVFDKTVDGGCSNKRPDVFIDCLTHSVIIECDENEHKDYSCENKRMMSLFSDLGNRPLVVIRFNPDSYMFGKNKIEGCFSFKKSGSLSINKKEWNMRTKKLIEVINKYIQEIPTKEISLEQLYYSRAPVRIIFED
jgi:hypothetical protein